MAISVMSAAKTACEESGWTLTNLSLQKLLYLAHMRYLGEHGGAPLLRDRFEAWKYGPVVSRLYQAVKKFGDTPISDIFFVERNLTRDEHEQVRATVAQYGTVAPGRLVELTHKPNGAWAKHYRPYVDHIVIPNVDIQDEHTRLLL